MDAFLGRTEYSSFLGADAINLRKWLPFNIRAFVVSLERYYNVREYIMKSTDSCLIGVFRGLVESYAGERGFMGAHRCSSFCCRLTEDKVYGFLEVVTKTGRSETNGGAGLVGDNQDRPWEKVHDSLADAMMERVSPSGSISSQPHEIRGSFQECGIKTRIISRQRIDRDRFRRTAKVTIDLVNTGVTFTPGDRVIVMPLNRRSDMDKVISAFDLSDLLDKEVPLNDSWKLYAQQMSNVHRDGQKLSVAKILRSGKISPLTKDTVIKVYPH